MEEASLLGNFVRLTDYILTSTLAQQVVGMSADLLASLQPEGSGRVCAQTLILCYVISQPILDRFCRYC